MRLYLCEKPSQAKDIAAVLGAKRRGDGCWLGTGVTVTWCIGHLLETAAPDAYDTRYKRWVLADLPIIPDKWKMTVKPRTASQYKAVRRLLGEADELVIATDADREGEMIARELVEHCRYRGPIQRLWLSALDDASIRKALAALKPGAETFSLYHSALGRSRADWLIGMNMSRLFTLLGRQSGYQGCCPSAGCKRRRCGWLWTATAALLISSPLPTGPSTCSCGTRAAHSPRSGVRPPTPVTTRTVASIRLSRNRRQRRCPVLRMPG